MNNANSIELTREQLDLICGGYADEDIERTKGLIRNTKLCSQTKECLVKIMCGAASWTSDKLVNSQTGLTQEQFAALVDELWDTVEV